MGSKKIVHQKEKPAGRKISQIENPDEYYMQHPSWCFQHCDNEFWTFSKETTGDYFWSNILPKLKGWESQTWNDIFLIAKKENHSLNDKMNPKAIKRLAELYIESDSILSLRVDGTHRLYGYMVNGSFNLLWYDSQHGDNDNCVYRTKKKGS